MDPCLVDDGSWTDEKHSHFLDFLETSFLHAMFGTGVGEHGRLDRELPDSCDSTRDSRPQIPRRRRRKTRLSEGMSKQPRKSTRWLSSTSRHHVDQSNDQLARTWGGQEDDVEEKEH